MSTQKRTFCRICEPMCPMLAELDDQGDITGLKPNPDHPSRGIACHKGLSYLEIHNDPDRLTQPLRRSNPRAEAAGDFEAISWDQALTECGEKLKAILDQHGPNAIGIYIGNPMAFNSRLMTQNQEFLKLIGTQMVFSAGTQDMTNKSAGAIAMYGSSSVMVPDIESTDYLLCLGSNPRVSKWVFFSTPNSSGKVLEQIRERGGKVCFVNPRKTESSHAGTGDTLLIKPGTDVYFLAAVVNELIVGGGMDTAMIDRYASNIDGLKQFVGRYPAERVASVTGINVAAIKQVAADIASAKSATVYLSTGINQSRQGLLCYWLSEMINFVSGNLGRKGGSYKADAYSNRYTPTALNTQFVETSLGNFGLPVPAGHMTLPGAMLAELIEAGDIKALVTLSGNPLMTIGGEAKMRDAFNKLDVMITLDIMRNATAELSDYVLAGTDFLERADVNLIANGIQSRPYAHYTEAVATPVGECKDDWWILSRLAEAMGLKTHNDNDDGFRWINKILSGAELSIDTLKALPEQVAVLPRSERDMLYELCLQHDDKKIHCYPPEFEDAGLFERCESIFNELSSEPEGTLKLISLRTPYMHNSWLANAQTFRRGAQSINPLNMCSTDAKAKGIVQGDKVRLFNDHGSIETRVQINDDLRPGAIALSHGYGAGRPGMRVAEDNPGANFNRLAPTGPGSYEPLSYMSWLSALPVEVERVSPASND